MLSGIHSPLNAWGSSGSVKSATKSPSSPQAVSRSDQFQRSSKTIPSGASSSLSAARSGKTLFQRVFQTPWTKRPGGSKSQPRTRIIAGAQHDRKEPRNPISFEALDSMLKELDNDVDPRIGSIMKEGYASGLKHLLKVGNQIVAEINQRTEQGHQNPKLVIYFDPPVVHGTLKDPVSERRYSYEIEAEKEVVCEVLTPRRLRTQFNAMNHWSNIARDKQGLSELEYLDFDKTDLGYMQETTRKHTKVPRQERFNLHNKEELADYAFQLFNMLYNLHLAREEMAQQFKNNPAQYKVGIASRSPGGETEIHDLSCLFPGCHLKVENTQPQGPFSELPLSIAAQRALLERLFREDN